jgi:hypothetical protein
MKNKFCGAEKLLKSGECVIQSRKFPFLRKVKDNYWQEATFTHYPEPIESIPYPYALFVYYTF